MLIDGYVYLRIKQMKIFDDRIFSPRKQPGKMGGIFYVITVIRAVALRIGRTDIQVINCVSVSLENTVELNRVPCRIFHINIRHQDVTPAGIVRYCSEPVRIIDFNITGIISCSVGILPIISCCIDRKVHGEAKPDT